MPSHYEVLGVALTATHGEIKKAFHRLALKNHPDKTQHLSVGEREYREQKFKNVNSAWETLSDATARQTYDRTLRSNPSSTSWTTESSGTWWTTPKPPNAPRKPKDPAPSGFPDPLPWAEHSVVDGTGCTTLFYRSSTGWEFFIDVSDKWNFTVGPVLTPPRDTAISVDITIQMVPNCMRSPIGLPKEVVIRMRATPNSGPANFATYFKNHGGEVMTLKITISAGLPSLGATYLSNSSWKYAFDIDHGYMAGRYTRFNATHLMFSEQYPIQAFQTSLGQQGTYPISSPMALLKADRPGIKLVQLPVDHYCMKIEYEGKEFYQVAAIGFEN